VSNGRASFRPVRIGRSNGVETEVLDGLEENDQVVVHPSDRIQGGVAVRIRPDGQSSPR
jgi:HlyD family secretion protein